jgi:hypothetical protein
MVFFWVEILFKMDANIFPGIERLFYCDGIPVVKKETGKNLPYFKSIVKKALVRYTLLLK